MWLIFFLFIPLLVEAKTADEWLNEGNQLGQAGNYAEAIKAFDEALKINIQFAEAWNNKGIALNNLGRNDEAIKALDEASKLQKALGFEIIFAIAGLVIIARLLNRKG